MTGAAEMAQAAATDSAARREHKAGNFGRAKMFADNAESLRRNAGRKAQQAGIPWWRNPYESGSAAAYQWDSGHTAARQSESVA